MQNFDSPAKDIKAFFLFFCVKRKKILTVQKFSIYKKLTHFLNKREESGSSWSLSLIGPVTKAI